MPPAGRKGQAASKHRQAGRANQGGQAIAGQAAVGVHAPSLPMLRNSERSQFKACRWRWDREFNDQLKPNVAMPALRYGSLWHAALACYYVPGVKRGENPVTAFERLYEKDRSEAEAMGFKDEEGKWHDAGELGVAMMQNYLDEYGDDDNWEVLVTEQPFQTLVRHPETQEPWFYYVGIVDGIWRHRPSRKLWVPDHKTTDSTSDKKWQYLVLDDQAGGYWSFGLEWIYAQGMLKPGEKLAGMLYNLARKAMPDERPSRLVDGKRLYTNVNGEISKRQPPAYFRRVPIYRDEIDRAAAMERAAQDYGEIEMTRLGLLHAKKTPGWQTCPYCWLRDACELHETGSDYLEFLRQTTKAWDPYAEHEIYNDR